MKAPNSKRQERLAAALRENLKRRKARERALIPPNAAADTAPGEPAVASRPKSAKKTS